jgi:2-dehydro-3-deoxygluconokinase
MNSTRKYDVVALGEPMIEFNQTVAGQANYLQGFGGDTSNAAIAAARAGAKAAYLTRIGNDWFGLSLKQLWETEGVDCSHIETDLNRPTGIYFVTHGASGHEFSYLRKGSAAAAMAPEWLPIAAIHNAKSLHVSGISLAISDTAQATVLQAMRIAKECGTLVALDSNLRLRLWTLKKAQAVIGEAIALSDLFLPSIDDLETLTGLTDVDKILDWCHAQGATKVVLKLGAQGCIVSDGLSRIALAGHPVTAVDATGAGDCFCGNLLARFTLGDSLLDAARYANKAAALAVQSFGAVAPLPFRAQVLEFQSGV